jgi:hypothetical protein
VWINSPWKIFPDHQPLLPRSGSCVDFVRAWWVLREDCGQLPLILFVRFRFEEWPEQFSENIRRSEKSSTLQIDSDVPDASAMECSSNVAP